MYNPAMEVNRVMQVMIKNSIEPPLNTTSIISNDPNHKADVLG